jgi:hypothetical protein
MCVVFVIVDDILQIVDVVRHWRAGKASQPNGSSDKDSGAAILCDVFQNDCIVPRFVLFFGSPISSVR